MIAYAVPGDSVQVEPHFQPFEGSSYRTPTLFPGRLLILGESHYLGEPEKDNTPDFTQRILRKVAADHLMTKWKTPYFRNLFYVFTGKSNRAVEQEDWETFWESIAFYNYVQSARLTHGRMRPNRDEWQEANAPFRTVLSRLQPELILITGTGLLGHVSAMDGVHERKERPGIWIPNGDNTFAYARCIYHPSSVRFAGARPECREIVDELRTPRKNES
jgi:hypothetical protein